MAQKAFAVGDFIVNDWEGLDEKTATIASILTGGIGLPGGRAQIINRYGRWPLISGLTRPGNRLTLETHFKGSDKYTQRRNLLAELNPESESVVKLYAADDVAPEGLICAFGPWNVYPDDDGAWFVDSVLGNAIGTFTNAVHFEDGVQSRQQAVCIEGAVTNLVTNPSLETNATNWATVGGATVSRSTDKAKYGGYSYKVVTPGSAAGEGCQYTQAALSGSTVYTASLWVHAPLASKLQLSFYDGVDQTVDATIVGTGDWQRLTMTHTTNASPSTTRIRLLTVSNVQNITFYMDALQIEQRSYSTAYCDGSLGGGYTWSGTEHGSSSSKTATELNLDDYASLITGKTALTIRTVIRVPEDHDGTWRTPAGNNFIWDLRISPAGSVPNPRFYLKFDSSNETIDVYFAGSERMNSTAQTFDAGDRLDIVVTIDHDNDSHALYIEGSEEDTSSASVQPPTCDEWNIGSNTAGGNHSDFWVAEFSVWDRALTAAEVSDMYNNGTVAGRARWVETLCEAAQPLVIGGVPTDQGVVATLALHDDVRWRSRDGDAVFSGLYADISYVMATTDSDDDVWPIIRLEPISAKTAGNGYAKKRWVTVKWIIDVGHIRYPTCITFDGAAEVSGGDMQADGDDCRVFVDGLEVTRWFETGSSAGQINSSTAHVWINLDFAPQVEMTLKTAIAGAGSIDEIELNEDISNLPNSGILLIDVEAFTYTAKNNADKKVTGITRDAKGTSQAAHTVDTDVFWMQHDIWLKYGDSGATAPAATDVYSPQFDESSSNNGDWVYASFGMDDVETGGGWQRQIVIGSVEFYGGDHGAAAASWGELGIRCADKWIQGRIYLYNPCGITNANFTSGEKYAATRPSAYEGYIRSSIDGNTWTDEHTIPVPTVGGAWQAWNQNEALTAGSLFVSLDLEDNQGGDYYVEASACTVTIEPTNLPVVLVRAEQSNYDMSMAIENETTGEAMEIDIGLLLNEILEIDTVAKTVTLLNDGTNQIQALTLTGGARRDWLKLQPGNNSIKMADTGQNEVDVEVFWNRRYWE